MTTTVKQVDFEHYLKNRGERKVAQPFVVPQSTRTDEVYVVLADLLTRVNLAIQEKPGICMDEVFLRVGRQLVEDMTLPSSPMATAISAIDRLLSFFERFQIYFDGAHLQYLKGLRGERLKGSRGSGDHLDADNNATQGNKRRR